MAACFLVRQPAESMLVGSVCATLSLAAAGYVVPATVARNALCIVSLGSQVCLIYTYVRNTVKHQ